MGNLWNITLTNQHNNATYTCALMDVPDASALRCLEIKWESGTFVAIVEPKSEGVYIKEVTVQGERLGFRKETGMLLPAERKVGDTWQVSTEKKKHRLARILFKMEVTVVAAEPQRLVLSVKANVNIRAPLKKVNETVEAVVSINPDLQKIERVQLTNGDIYEKRA